MLVVVGLLLVLTGYGLQFIKGAASVLPLTYDEIHAFTVVNEKMSELLAPYEYLKNFIIILDLLVLVTVFASAVTLRSRRIHWHKLLVIAAPVVGALDILLTMRYSQLTSEALIQLPTLGYSGSLAIIMDVQQKFGIPSPHLNMLIDIDSVIGLGLLVLAALTPKIVNEHKPSS
jgi:predicted ferric reductase